MVCISCHADFHSVCMEKEDHGYCCCVNETTAPIIESFKDSLLSELQSELPEPKVFKDDLSTGRKRAAKAAPITDGLGCEWSGLKFAGGGVIPIVGCRPEEELQAVARHHGPDKSTFNNELGTIVYTEDGSWTLEPPRNLHRICVRCHNRWHTRNDEYYGLRPSQGEAYLPREPMPCLPHDPATRAEESDYAAAEEYWSKHRALTAKPEPEEDSGEPV